MPTLEDLAQELIHILHQTQKPLDQRTIQRVHGMIQQLQLQTSQSPHLQQLIAQAQHLMATCQAQQAHHPLSIQHQPMPSQSHVSPTSSYQPHPSTCHVTPSSTYHNPSHVNPYRYQSISQQPLSYATPSPSTHPITTSTNSTIPTTTSTHSPTTTTSHITSPNTIPTSTNSTPTLCVITPFNFTPT